MNSQINDRFAGNVSRVRHLLEIYRTTSGKGRGRRAVDVSDVLRAAVVLLHAAVEDVLRSLERRVLPRADAALLNDVALVDHDSPSKFALGALAAHRGKAVDVLIDESVARHLERATYNNARELAAVLKRLGADPADFQNYFADLEAMMKRRHNIVHRADREETRGSGHHGFKSLSQQDVVGWANVAEEFVRRVFDKVPDLGGAAP